MSSLVLPAGRLSTKRPSTLAALMRLAAHGLSPEGRLVLYGPYLEDEVPTSPGNLAFDADLRERNPAWGLRRREDVLAQALGRDIVRIDLALVISKYIGEKLGTHDRRGTVQKLRRETSGSAATYLAGGSDDPLPVGLRPKEAHVYRTLASVPKAVWTGWNAEFQTLLERLSVDTDNAYEVLKEHTTQTRYAMARQLMAEQRNKTLLDEIDGQVSPTVDGTYQVLVIDPPWPMTKILREERPNQVGFDYPTMSEDELRGLEIPTSTGELRSLAAVADEACHVWLWTTQRFLPMAFRLLEAWDFTYVCTFVWHKPGGFQAVGLPQYNCEFALYARKGSPTFADTKQLFTCFEADRGRHSEKPDEFFATVARVTDGPRLEVFARRVRIGFDGWGNEVGRG
jgi:N6-adenosine-specific RNA methylase IME4